ncbi:MAG: hypothetical protein JHC93_06765 [Parachlamydiales bacterium]|nr:hypothetical protein [Parachlamydiales bacterium]
MGNIISSTIAQTLDYVFGQKSTMSNKTRKQIHEDNQDKLINYLGYKPDSAEATKLCKKFFDDRNLTHFVTETVFNAAKVKGTLYVDSKGELNFTKYSLIARICMFFNDKSEYKIKTIMDKFAKEWKNIQQVVEEINENKAKLGYKSINRRHVEYITNPRAIGPSFEEMSVTDVKFKSMSHLTKLVNKTNQNFTLYIDYDQTFAYVAKQYSL